MLVECGRETQALSIYDLYTRAAAYSGGLGHTQPSIVILRYYGYLL